jgi:hypothetical protein
MIDIVQQIIQIRTLTQTPITKNDLQITDTSILEKK